MRSLVFALVIVAVGSIAAQQSPGDVGIETSPPEKFSKRVVTTEKLLDPWDMVWGPDGYLWVTERASHNILRVDPQTGAKTALVTVEDAYNVDTQDGLLGLALHPGLLQNRGQEFVYVSYTYNPAPGSGKQWRMRLRRYTYDARANKLTAPLDLLTALPSGDDHSGGRLLMGADQKLYLTLGDLAANHLTHPCQPNRAQDLPSADDVKAQSWTTYQGKILRINLDGSIPADNPILAGVRSHVFSYGHRNPQGLALGPDGKIYSSEHGPVTDDELNLIRSGKNYGWPYVSGYTDDLNYVYANWSASSPTPCSGQSWVAIGGAPGVPQTKETAWSHPDFIAPLRTFFTSSESGLTKIVPSGIEVYKATGAGAIPGWSNSVLITSLSTGSIFRVKLSADGTQAVGKPIQYFVTGNRYRDVAVSADGRTIFVSVDGWPPKDHAGAILAFSLETP